MNEVNRIINAIIDKEGGYTNHPQDRGGPTNYGITMKLYLRYKKDATITDLKNLTRSTAYSIYETEFYIDTGIYKMLSLSAELTYDVLDTAVNMGPRNAVKILQRCLNVFNSGGAFYPDVAVDGDLGEGTLAALTAFHKKRGNDGISVLLKTLNCLRGVRYVELAEKYATNEAFIYGWMAQRVK